MRITWVPRLTGDQGNGETDATYAFHSHQRSVGRRVRHGLPRFAKKWRCCRRCRPACSRRVPERLTRSESEQAAKKNRPALTLAGMEYAVIHGLDGEPAVGIEPTTAPLKVRGGTWECSSIARGAGRVRSPIRVESSDNAARKCNALAIQSNGVLHPSPATSQLAPSVRL